MDHLRVSLMDEIGKIKRMKEADQEGRKPS